MKNLATFLIGLALFAAPVAASADTFTRPLAVGSRGEDVTLLQKILFDGSFLKIAPTGYFGVLTKSAVIAYQLSIHLDPVGSVGPKTRAALNAYTALPQNQTPMPAQTPTPSSGTTSNAIVPVSSPTQNPTTTPPQVGTTTPVVQAPTPSPNDPPIITLISPAAAISRTSSETTFSVMTDKPALCRYGTLEGMSSSYMTQFTVSNGTVHSKNLTGLSPDSYYIYYVRCEDNSAHVSKDLMVSFWTNAQ